MSVLSRPRRARAASVQACITAVGFPDTPDAVRRMVEKNAEMGGARTDVGVLLSFREGHDLRWTAPRWIAPGDLLLSYHTSRGAANARRLEKALLGVASPVVRAAISEGLEQAKRFEGTIFAVGEVGGGSEYEGDPAGRQHFESRFFAPLERVHVLPRSVPKAEFEQYVTLSPGGTLTPVLGTAFNALRDRMAATNPLPSWVADAAAGAPGFHDVTRDNWHAVVRDPGRRFLDEGQVRAYWADYLLDELRDARTLVHAECDCYRKGLRTGIADCVVCVGGTWTPVETKLALPDLGQMRTQLRKYLHVSEFTPRMGRHAGRVVRGPTDGVAILVDQAAVHVTLDGEFGLRGKVLGCWPRTEMNRGTAREVRTAVAGLRERN
ncbi:MAG: hypothetical protein HY275_06135 [Gemmatimonadetes bacterium]|nr:hypothetical protein [Gemmatimonadota bacterium]